MSGLVGYASSDEEDDIQPTKPAKIAKINAHDGATTTALDSKPHTKPANEAFIPATNPTNTDSIPPDSAPALDPPAPIPSVAAALLPQSDPTIKTASSETPPLSPYTTERGALRNLTMPTHPNFNIPSSPSPPPQNSEAALALSTTTKKFDRFLELKKQGVHFNARLENSASLRNPGLLGKLMEFAGIEEADSYQSTLSKAKEGEGGDSGELGVPVKWPEEWFVENLMKENEKRERTARKERGEVEFVRAREGEKSGASSKAGTPKGGSEHRKSKFERR